MGRHVSDNDNIRTIVLFYPVLWIITISLYQQMHILYYYISLYLVSTCFG